MIKKKFWKQSLSLFLACTLVVTSGCFDFQLGNVTVSAANVQAKESEEEAGKLGEPVASTVIAAENEGDTENAVSDNSADATGDITDEQVKDSVDETPRTVSEEWEETEEDEDIIPLGTEEEAYSGAELANTVITDIDLLKGLAFVILSDADSYDTLTIADIQQFNGDVDFTNYEGASKVKSLKGAGLAKKAASFHFEKCIGVTEIASEEFKNCDMQSIGLPDTIQKIGQQAFYDCSKLTQIKSGATENALPASLTQMGTNAFERCSALETVIIPDTVGSTALQHATSMFAYCTSLKSVTIGANISIIPDSAFVGAGAAENMQIIIHANSQLEKIGEKAFAGAKLSAIDFSNCNRLGTIGASAFSESTLSSVVLPDAVTNSGQNKLVLGKSAFASAASFTTLYKKTDAKTDEVVLPEYVSVNNASTGIFFGCTELKKVTIPSSWTLIPESTFSSCEKLEEVNIASGSSELTTICKEAFFNSGIKNTNFLLQCGKLTTLMERSFQYCTSLESVVLPASVTTIESQVFSGVEDNSHKNINMQLTSFTWNTDVSKAVNGGKRVLGSQALASCESLEKVMLPDYSGQNEKFEIGAGAFEGDIKLSEVKTKADDSGNMLPVAVSKIGDKAFYNCAALPQIKIPTAISAPELGVSIFEKCTKLKSVELPANITCIPEKAFCNAGVTQLIIGNTANKIESSSLTTIGARSFFGCQIEVLDLSGCPVLEEIDGWAFAGVDSQIGSPTKGKKSEKEVLLTTLILPEYLDSLFLNSGIFDHAEEFTTLATPGYKVEGTAYIPDYVCNGSRERVGIGEGTFCATLINNVILPASWTGTLPKAAFSLCPNIGSLDFLTGTNLTALGEQCFYGCLGLEDISLKDNHTIKEIGKECFKDCLAVKSTESKPMTLPSSLETIQASAFALTLLEYLDLSGNTMLKTMGESAFSTTTLTTVKLPSSLTVVSKNCFKDNADLKKVEFGGVTTIGESAFSGCTSLDLTGTSLELIQTIGRSAFLGDMSLGKVVFGSNLTTINQAAFKGCADIDESSKRMTASKIVEFDFTKAVKLNKIGVGAFEQSAVKSVDMSKTAVTAVDTGLFKSCELLEDVTFGPNVSYIGADVLAICPALKTVNIYSTTVVNPLIFNAKNIQLNITTNKNVSFTVRPVKEVIKIAVNDTIDFPYYVHMVNSDRNAPKDTKPYLHIVVGDSSHKVPEADKNNIYLAVSGDIEGYYINDYKNNDNLIGGTYESQDGSLVNNFVQESHTKQDASTNKQKVDVFQVTGVKSGKYPFYVCCQIKFPVGGSYSDEACISSNFTTTYMVEVAKAYYKADIYQSYDVKAQVLSDKLKTGSTNSFQADGKNKNVRLYYNFTYNDASIDDNNISDYNVTVVSDNPAVMYPGKAINDATAKVGGKTPGTITTAVAERDKTNQDRKSFFLLPAGVGTAHIKVYPSAHPAGSKDAELYAQNYTYVVGADLKAIQLVGPKDMPRTIGPNESVQLETKITNYLGQTATVTSSADLAKYTNNKIVYASTQPNLLTINQNGLVKVVNAENKQVNVKVTATARKSDNTDITATATIGVKWPEIAAGKSYTDSKTGAKVKVTVKANQDGEVTYVKPASTTATTVKIPSKVTICGVEYKVTKISSNAFKNNKKLKKVTIPSTITEIGSKAFYNCTALKSITMGKNVTTIGSSAFYNCKALTSITLGKKVTTIGKKAFYNCKKLKKITIKSTVLSKVGSQAFKNIYKKATIKVPKKKLADYKKLLKGKGQSSKVKIKK